MISMFPVMVSGVGDPLNAGGIGEALVCTASGLCVAIPAYSSTAISGPRHRVVIDMKAVIALTDD